MNKKVLVLIILTVSSFAFGQPLRAPTQTLTQQDVLKARQNAAATQNNPTATPKVIGVVPSPEDPSQAQLDAELKEARDQISKDESNMNQP